MRDDRENDLLVGLGTLDQVLSAHLSRNDDKPDVVADLQELRGLINCLRKSVHGRFAVSAVLCALLNSSIESGGMLFYTTDGGKVSCHYVSNDTALRLCRRAMSGE